MTMNGNNELFTKYVILTTKLDLIRSNNDCFLKSISKTLIQKIFLYAFHNEIAL